MRTIAALALCTSFALGGCKKHEEAPEPTEFAPVTPGEPEVGAAEGHLHFPVGTPLAGYTHRCSCMTGYGRVDSRESAYNWSFIESTGVHTTPTVKAIWIDNGDDHLVLLKTDNIYSFDGLVEELGVVLEERTGERVANKIAHTTNHTHHGWGTFTQQKAFYLGSDRFNKEIYTRMLEEMARVAIEAYDNRVPAKIGMSWAKDWDPDNLVYRDRRSENDTLAVWDDVEPGMGKDPYLGLMRFDTLDDDPIALVFNFGIHGILLEDENPMVSGDAPLAVEFAVQEQFDEPVVAMFTQSSGGDASPAGTDDGYAKAETIGAHAVGPIMELYDATPTSADPIRLQTSQRHIPQHMTQIEVSRGDDVLVYTDYQGPDFRPDEVIYNDDGSIQSPIDEFQSSYGSVFCGTGDLDFPVGRINTSAWPYSNCMEIELMSRIILAFFDLTEEEMPLPLPETLKAGTAATRLGPIPTLLPDGKEVTQDLLMGFFPGEATAMFTEQWRRRVKAELGMEWPLMISYAQDHEGYLLIPEDWLMGEYEADISFWGPLQAEHIMEGVLQMVDETLLVDDHVDVDPWKEYTPTDYWEEELPTLAPDMTPKAGTRIMEPPPRDCTDTELEEGFTSCTNYFTPQDFGIDFVIPTEVKRGQGVLQLGWMGGDPGVDFPVVTIERKDGGKWKALETRAGRTVNQDFHDIILGYTPDPLFPHEAKQDHYWWAQWQAVNHVHDLLGLPLGTYRIKVSGKHYAGGDQTWPWSTKNYEVLSDEFELVPADVTITADVDGVWASVVGPAKGFRMLALWGNRRGDNPLNGELTVDVETAAGTDSFTVDAGDPQSGRTWVPVDLTDALSVTVTDEHGNTGTLTF